MEKMIGICGIICTECPAFIATKKDDDNARMKVAETWSKEYNNNFSPEDINCEGCISTKGILFNHCAVCEYRKCAIDKNNSNCAKCEKYACEKISQFHKIVPDAKKVLDNINGK